MSTSLDSNPNLRGTQREYSSKRHKHSVVERIFIVGLLDWTCKTRTSKRRTRKARTCKTRTQDRLLRTSFFFIDFFRVCKLDKTERLKNSVHLFLGCFIPTVQRA